MNLYHHWETMPEHFDYFPREDRQLVVNTIIADKVESLVEFAMGTGIVPKMLRETGYTGRYVGTDCVENFINISKQHNPDEDIRYADLNETLPFKDKEFEASVIFTGLGYCKDLESTLKEIKRVTAKYIYIDQFNFFADKTNLRFFRGEGWGNQYNKDEFLDILSRVGLSIILEATIINGKDYEAIKGIPTSKHNYFLKLCSQS